MKPRFEIPLATTLRPLLAALALLAAAGLLVQFLQQRLARPLLTFGLHPEVIELLEASLADQRELARWDPAGEVRYRQRFAAIETLLGRLRVVEHNRGAIVKRYEQIAFTTFAVLALVATTAFVWRQGRTAARLARLGDALEGLAAGRTDLELGERGRDLLGRVARMVERTSRRMARDRARLAALGHLSSWQEAARRHAHEMRTPLTGARLELERLEDLIADEPLERGDEIRRLARSAGQEIDRLGTFAKEFSAFARLPSPEPRRHDLDALLAELAATFGGAWPHLELRHRAGAEPLWVAVDRDLLRQVLVNLCDNAAQAMGSRGGRVELAARTEGENIVLRVSDTGPGVAASVRQSLFEPYTTTRRVGEGMGLGLAICKKILLDHGGDLELESTSEAGTTFRATFPTLAEAPCHNERPS